MRAVGVRHRGLGVSSLGLLVLTFGGVIGAFCFCWVVVAAPPDGYPDVLSVAGACSLLLPLLLLSGTSRVAADRTGFIDLVSLLVTYRVPIEQVAAVEYENGLQLRLVSGRRLGTVAFGDSLIGQITGQRRSRRVARRVDAFLRSSGWKVPSDWRQDDVRARVRLTAVCVAVGVSLALIGSTLLINAMWRGAL